MANASLLRAVMLGLVLLNLVFVQLTEATSWERLAPLYGLTLLSPALSRWREAWVYRWAWNMAVLGVFGILIQTIVAYRLSDVLQDGLILAVTCQVHLLNNLREDQRPDLLFINSFLVAAVTGYLCEDLEFAVAFLVYAPLLWVGLQLLCVSDDQGRLETGLGRAIFLDGLGRSVVLLLATLLAFFFWPRDFQRPGWVTTELNWDEGGAALKIGFNEEISHRSQGQRAQASNRRVMTIEVPPDWSGEPPLLWRGATQVQTDGQRWRNPGGLAGFDGQDDRWSRRGTRWVRSQQEPLEGRFSVQLHQAAGRIFTPLRSVELGLEEGQTGRLRGEFDGTWRIDASGKVNYHLRVAGPPSLGGVSPETWDPGLARFLQLPDAEVVREASRLAQRWIRPARSREQYRQVQELQAQLGRRFEYAWPGEPQSAGSLNEFLGGASGHCEYFASAMAIMLRTQNIPSRVVTGYRGTASADRKTIEIRERDAHAWVEVFDPRGGWYAVDPTPAAGNGPGGSWWGELRAQVESGWSLLTSFDAQRRQEVLQRVGHWLEGQRSRLGWALLVGALVPGGLLLRWWRRRVLREPSESRDYRRALSRARLQLRAGETPRELLERARREGLQGEELERIQAATERHELGRYAA